MHLKYRHEEWFLFLDHGMQDLVSQSLILLKNEQTYKSQRFHDYSFLVFPIARAYEGFLKKLFFRLDLIDKTELLNRHFRIGRSLNPDLPERFKDNSWLYDDILLQCMQHDAPELAENLWNAWKMGRNQLFHYYFPDHYHFISLSTAEERVTMFITVMSSVLDCGLIETPAIQ